MLDTQMPRNSQRDECEKLTSSDEKRIIELEADVKELASALKEASNVIYNVGYNNVGNSAIVDEYKALANKYLANTPPIKEK